MLLYAMTYEAKDLPTIQMPLPNSVMMGTPITVMAVMTNAKLSLTGCVKEEVPHLQMFEWNETLSSE